MKKETHYPPKYKTGSFYCPYCDVYAGQAWAYIIASPTAFDSRFPMFPSGDLFPFHETLNPEKWLISKCSYCNNYIIWRYGEVLYPKTINIEPPNDDLNDDIKKDYLEAAAIFNDSPRASAALLRLALQKLCIQLGEKGSRIDDDIKSLVAKGLDSSIQKSMDFVRIIGNNAVHPGEINVEENADLVSKLFRWINFIAEKMLSEPKEIDELFKEKIPEKAKEHIVKRDGPK